MKPMVLCRNLLMVLTLAVLACAPNPKRVTPDRLGGEQQAEGGSGTAAGLRQYYVKCQGLHDGIFGWESGATDSRFQANQWARDHKKEFGHSARVQVVDD